MAAPKRKPASKTSKPSAAKPSGTKSSGARLLIDDAKASFEVITVPGSLEIVPAIAIALDAAEKQQKPYDGVVALGCVIQGETFHFDIVAMQSARALLDFSVERRIPCGNGILTT